MKEARITDVDADIIDESEDAISVCCGVSLWTNAEGLLYLEEDYRIAGEIWRVHKGDPDPLPSNPHAHCIDGSNCFKGCKLHLGTRQLFTGNNKALDRYLAEDQFERLIAKVARKFPDITFPLEA
jgi:hypothetical protein